VTSVVIVNLVQFLWRNYFALESCCSFLLTKVAKILVFSSNGGNCSQFLLV
jgi:hypothetical protein